MLGYGQSSFPLCAADERYGQPFWCVGIVHPYAFFDRAFDISFLFLEIGKDVVRQALVTACGFFILNCNPFLLEFFSLGRGYGLANAFVMASIFYTGFYFKTKKKQAVWGMFISLFLAVLSNFTALNFYACLLAAVGLVFLLIFFKKEKPDWAFWKYLFVVGLLVTAILFALIFMPVTTLSGAGEFEYGAKSLWDTFSSNCKIKVTHSGV